jgi:hypothetical protein
MDLLRCCTRQGPIQSLSVCGTIINVHMDRTGLYNVYILPNGLLTVFRSHGCVFRVHYIIIRGRWTGFSDFCGIASSVTYSSDAPQRIVTISLYRARIFKLLKSPRINSKESFRPEYVAWRAGATTLFLFGS